MSVNVYASVLCTEKDFITCGNINHLMFIKECNKTRFSLGELDIMIKFLCVIIIYYLTIFVYVYIYIFQL